MIRSAISPRLATSTVRNRIRPPRAGTRARARRRARPRPGRPPLRGCASGPPASAAHRACTTRVVEPTNLVLKMWWAPIRAWATSSNPVNGCPSSHSTRSGGVTSAPGARSSRARGSRPTTCSAWLRAACSGSALPRPAGPRSRRAPGHPARGVQPVAQLSLPGRRLAPGRRGACASASSTASPSVTWRRSSARHRSRIRRVGGSYTGFDPLEVGGVDGDEVRLQDPVHAGQPLDRLPPRLARSRARPGSARTPGSTARTPAPELAARAAACPTGPRAGRSPTPGGRGAASREARA